MTSDEKKRIEDDLFATATRISRTEPWFISLGRRILEFREARRNPRPGLVITAARDPSALSKLIDPPSPFVSLLSQVRTLVREALDPKPFRTTATPVAVEEIWSKPNTGVPRLTSICIHALIVLLVFVPWPSFTYRPPQVRPTVVMLETSRNTKLILNLATKPGRSGGGGGGGKRQQSPASLGRLPRAADKQFLPPDPEPPKNLNPTLVVEPTVIAPQLAELPHVNLPNLGDPFGVAGLPSSGPGVGGGIGTGEGHGVGEGRGPGVGPGEGGGYGGGVYRVGGGVTSPVVIYRVEPQYSEDARKARYQGTVVLAAVVRRDGKVDIIRIIRSLGFGLDEKAIDALKEWRFRPGTKNGQPVDTALNIEVNFTLR